MNQVRLGKCRVKQQESKEITEYRWRGHCHSVIESEHDTKTFNGFRWRVFRPDCYVIVLGIPRVGVKCIRILNGRYYLPFYSHDRS